MGSPSTPDCLLVPNKIICQCLTMFCELAELEWTLSLYLHPKKGRGKKRRGGRKQKKTLRGEVSKKNAKKIANAKACPKPALRSTAPTRTQSDAYSAPGSNARRRKERGKVESITMARENPKRKELMEKSRSINSSRCRCRCRCRCRSTYSPRGDSPQHRTVISVQSIADVFVSRRESSSWEGVPDGQTKSMITSPRFWDVMYTFTCTCSRNSIPSASDTLIVDVEVLLLNEPSGRLLTSEW